MSEQASRASKPASSRSRTSDFAAGQEKVQELTGDAQKIGLHLNPCRMAPRAITG
jgi:hypothetical protein